MGEGTTTNSSNGRADGASPATSMSPPVVRTKVRIPSDRSMPVERLDGLLDVVWRHRLALVVAPAGSGKTTQLARFAARAPGPVGWYRAEPWDRDEAALLRHVEAALAPSLEGIPHGWESVADAANALDAWAGEPILLVVDDLHTIEGTPAEAALERLVEYAPPSLTILAASRVPPGFNLPRLRVSGVLAEIGGDDLRFRSWEVERLFRDFYQEPLPPEELARLARSTEGWAAGLQLFHLATRGKPPDERRRVLTALGPSSRLMRDYLTRNVLHELPFELRRFLVETSVLGRLSGALCDRLLGRTGSAEILLELEGRRLFTHALADDGVYRYHEVLRSYLQGVLIEEQGEVRARERFRTAGELLAETGALAEALEAYCRAEDGDAARRLLGRGGEAAVGGAGAWVDAIPATLLLHDPWLLLATARRLRAEGRFAAAIERYQRAEQLFGSMEAAVTCRDERQALSVWLDGATSSRRDPSTMLRAAVRREPLAVARDPGPADATPTAALVRGLAWLLSGHVVEARQRLLATAADVESSGVVQSIAVMAAGAAALIGGEPHGAVEIAGAVAAAEGLGLDWLARIGRASLCLGGGGDAAREAEAVAEACAAERDAWGEAFVRFVIAWGRIASGGEAADAERIVARFRRLDAPVLEGWALGLAAVSLARAGAPDANQAAVQTEAAARSAGVSALRLLSSVALAELSPEDSYGDLVEQIANETGIRMAPARDMAPTDGAVSARGDGTAGNGAMFVGGVPTGGNGLSHPGNGVAHPGNGVAHPGNGVAHPGNGVAHPGNGVAHPVPDDAEAPGGSPLRIGLLGGFRFERSGVEVDLSSVRPRVRTLLRLLALDAGAPVHHETIEAALWPDADADGASRNLHVAVAALRRAIEPAATRGGFALVRREGDAYRLVVPAGGEVDLQRFERLVAKGYAARASGDVAGAMEALQGALVEYRGDLLPEDGPAEWVTERRDRCRATAVGAAQVLGELLLAEGDAAGAARACADGLRIERYHDPLWRLLIEARDRAGDQGAATRARLGYDRMLAELGVEGQGAVPAPAMAPARAAL